MRASLGQTQVMTAVLLGGILVVGIGAAYTWGLPLLQKNQDVTDARNSLEGMKQLGEGIADVAQQGGSRSVPLSLGEGSLIINAENDTITYRAQTRGAYVSTRDWVPLNENDMQGVPEAGNAAGYGIRGVDKPGVLIGRATQGGGTYLTTYRLLFRNLLDPSSEQTYRIDLVEDGKLEASNGQHEIVFRRQEPTQTDALGVEGGIRNRIQILIRIS